MPSILPNRYPLDLTGSSADNAVVGEPHSLVSKKLRVIAPQYAPFFKSTLVVIDAATQTALLPTQYRCMNLVPLPSAMMGQGKEVYAIVVITDQSIGSEVTLSYQTLGGDYARAYTSTKELLDSLSADTRPAAWSNILDKPDDWTPALHYHAVGDAIGWEYITVALENLRNALLLGDAVDHALILNYFDEQVSTVVAQQQAIYADSDTALLTHRQNTDNPHQVTKAQVGLGNVQNYPIATLAEAKAGLSAERYMTVNLVASAAQEKINQYATQTQTLITQRWQEGYDEGHAVGFEAAAPTYALLSNTSHINGGETVVFTVNTANVPNGTVLGWNITSTQLTELDFTDDLFTGSVTIVGNTGVINRTAANARTSPGDGAFTMSLRIGTPTGPLAAVATAVTIRDIPVVETYTLTGAVTTVKEGQTASFTVSAINTVDNTRVYWTFEGTNIDASDFASGQNSGSVLINNESASFVIYPANEGVLEANAVVTVKLRTGSLSGPVVASTTVTLVSVDMLDISFGISGLRQMSSDGATIADGVAILSDGDIIVGSTAQLYRYTSAGNLDTSYTSVLSGPVLPDAPSLIFGAGTQYNAFIAQPDDKIIGLRPMLDGFALYRHNTDGTLDTSFGTSGLMSFFSEGGEESNYLWYTGLSLQADGKILVVGYTTSRFMIHRVNGNGTLDFTFDYNGSSLAQGWNGTPISYTKPKVSIQSNGKIVVTGGTSNFTTMRLNADGSQDLGYGIKEVSLSIWGATANLSLSSPLLNNKTVVIGTTYAQDTSGATAEVIGMLGYNENGTLDTAFGVNGIAKIDINFDNVNYNRVTVSDAFVLPSGKLVVVGQSGTNVTFRSFVACFNANGTLDTTFNTTGVWVRKISALAGVSATDYESFNAVTASQDDSTHFVVQGVLGGKGTLVRYSTLS